MDNSNIFVLFNIEQINKNKPQKMERLTKKEKEISFSNWWYEVPLRDVRKIKKQIMERCYISRNVFHHWVEGNTEIPELALPIIEEIAGKKIFTKE